MIELDVTDSDATTREMAMNDDQIERLATLYRAIADPARLRILGELAAAPRTGTELAERLSLTPPTISHHMARLTATGLVQVTPDAQRRIYSLNQDALRESGLSAPKGKQASGERDEQANVLRAFFDGERLKSIPAQRKKRVIVLRHLLLRFAPETDYGEREVNDLLRPAHDDVATLRRELVDYGFMTRERGVYRVATQLPGRSPLVAQETGTDEADWFASLVGSRTAAALEPAH